MDRNGNSPYNAENLYTDAQIYSYLINKNCKNLNDVKYWLGMLGLKTNSGKGKKAYDRWNREHPPKPSEWNVKAGLDSKNSKWRYLPLDQFKAILVPWNNQWCEVAIAIWNREHLTPPKPVRGPQTIAGVGKTKPDNSVRPDYDSDPNTNFECPGDNHFLEYFPIQGVGVQVQLKLGPFSIGLEFITFNPYTVDGLKYPVYVFMSGGLGMGKDYNTQLESLIGAGFKGAIGLTVAFITIYSYIIFDDFYKPEHYEDFVVSLSASYYGITGGLSFGERGFTQSVGLTATPVPISISGSTGVGYYKISDELSIYTSNLFKSALDIIS